MEKRQVKIGPEFFAKAKQDYSDWKFALIREYLQNSIDAKGSNRIVVGVKNHDGGTLLTVENNGEAMTEDILLNKLLVLGGSGKGFDGTIGGFGKAKEILYFTHKSYAIRTGTLEVKGSGADYTIQRDLPFFKGTRSEVVLSENIAPILTAQVNDFAALTQWDGELIAAFGNAPMRTLPTNTRKGHPVREFSWGKVYVSKQSRDKLVVRAGGIPMFTKYIDLDRMVIVELEGASSKALQSSRDALKSQPGWELDKLIQELAVDKKSALKDRSKTTYKVWQGKSLNVETPSKDKFVALREAALKPATGQLMRWAANVQAPSALVGASAQHYTHSPLGFQFVIKSEDGKRAKKGYADLEDLNTNGKLLAIGWSKVMLKLWELFGEKTPFNVGFVFSDDAVAQYHKSQEYGHVFFINPLFGGGKAATKWLLSPNGHIWELIATAAHEFVHYKGFGAHDERYTSYYTGVVEPIVLRYADEFKKCFDFAKTEMKGPQ